MAHNFGLTTFFRLNAMTGACFGIAFEPIWVPVILSLIAGLILLLVHSHDHTAYCVICSIVHLADTNFATGPHMSNTQL